MAASPRLGAWRSGIIFCVGIGGIIYVTITEGTDRPTLLILFAAMIGLPAFLLIDEGKRNGDK